MIYKNIFIPYKEAFTILLLLFLLCSCQIKGTNRLPEAEEILNRLAERHYLPQEIIAALPEFSLTEEEAFKSYFLHQWNDNQEEFNHKLAFSTDAEGNLISYQYKSYYFDEMEFAAPLNLETGLILACDFSRDFLAEGSNLEFSHQVVENNIYDPGHVESYVAYDMNGNAHIIMVDLDFGAIIRYDIADDL